MVAGLVPNRPGSVKNELSSIAVGIFLEIPILL